MFPYKSSTLGVPKSWGETWRDLKLSGKRNTGLSLCCFSRYFYCSLYSSYNWSIAISELLASIITNDLILWTQLFGSPNYTILPRCEIHETQPKYFWVMLLRPMNASITLWPNDATGQHRSGSTSTQTVACKKCKNYIDMHLLCYSIWRIMLYWRWSHELHRVCQREQWRNRM